MIWSEVAWAGRVSSGPHSRRPARLLDEVQHLAAELQAVALANLKALQDTQIPALETRALDQIAILLTGRRSSSRSCNNGRAIRVTGSEPEVAVTRCQSKRSLTAKQVQISARVLNLNCPVVAGVILQITDAADSGEIVVRPDRDRSSLRRRSRPKNISG